MAEYTAQLRWQRGEHENFIDQRYSRRHTLRFDGGVVLAASSSPSVVPLPMSDAAAVDPEEMFVAALSSCHMLWFLSLAATRGQVVDRYEDEAVGVMSLNVQGRWAMTRVTLRPRVEFAGTSAPDATVLAMLHHDAHEACFIASSVKTEVRCEPRT
ncbi:MAG: OsmC family protein [Betaproteobacteria bacterium]|nr:OsmC family protein [Betaproteobacteria bacterium]